MKHIARILLCALLLTSVLLCACGDISDEYTYELIYKNDSLVLTEDGTVLDTWAVEDIFAISGYFMEGLDFATAQGEEEIRAVLKTLFKDGVGLSLTTEAAISYNESDPFVISMFGMACEDIPTSAMGYYRATDGLAARFYVIHTPSEEDERNGTFVFVDRHGNYYSAQTNVTTGDRLTEHMISNHRQKAVRHD